jgi:hypothetical protein
MHSAKSGRKKKKATNGKWNTFISEQMILNNTIQGQSSQFVMMDLHPAWGL